MSSVRINDEDFSLHREKWNGNGFKVTQPTKEEDRVYHTVYEYHKRVVEYEEDDEGKLIEKVFSVLVISSLLLTACSNEEARKEEDSKKS